MSRERTDKPYHLRILEERRLTWDETWLRMADTMALRSQCSRAKVGAVIVDENNRVISMGYNGPSWRLNVEGPCTDWCPRAMGGDTGSDYSSCPSIHAEANAIVFADKSTMKNGTIYISRAACADCAKLIANTPVGRVVMRVLKEDAHREPAKTVALLESLGVAVAEVRLPGTISPWALAGERLYRDLFYREHGYGPHMCYFCDESMSFLEVVHHLNEDREDNSLENLVAAHRACHLSHHGTGGDGRGFYAAGFEHERIVCETCGMESTPGPMAQHRKSTGH